MLTKYDKKSVILNNPPKRQMNQWKCVQQGLDLYSIKPPCINSGNKKKVTFPSRPTLALRFHNSWRHQQKAPVTLVSPCADRCSFAERRGRDGSVIVPLSLGAINQGTLRSMPNNFNRFIQTVPHN